ncbi:MAG: hypothetical protein KDJ80_11710 [Nitratireductor sp.]|nr:hypothetical protein [Nitratireductor sp.]
MKGKPDPGGRKDDPRKQALRANLMRRKQQQRGLGADTGDRQEAGRAKLRDDALKPDDRPLTPRKPSA